MSPIYLKNIAIIGAAGQFGKQITSALLTQNKHHLTALTRSPSSSSSSLPPGIHSTAQISYTDPQTITSALQTHKIDVLIITMGVLAPRSAHTTLIDAAAAAGVKYVMPNEYGLDPFAPHNFGSEAANFAEKLLSIRAEIEDKGMSWVSLVCGSWYEFSLAGTECRYGFDFGKREVTMFDGGDVKISHSTWGQAARAVAKIWALPVEEGEGLTLEKLRNKSVFVRSFLASQKDMLEAVLRVTGDKREEWKVLHEGTRERWERGGKMVEEGDFKGHAVRLYARQFFADGASDYSDKLNNKDLELEEEGIDAPTKTAIEMQKVSDGSWTFHW